MLFQGPQRDLSVAGRALFFRGYFFFNFFFNFSIFFNLKFFFVYFCLFFSYTGISRCLWRRRRRYRPRVTVLCGAQPMGCRKLRDPLGLGRSDRERWSTWTRAPVELRARRPHIDAARPAGRPPSSRSERAGVRAPLRRDAARTFILIYLPRSLTRL